MFFSFGFTAARIRAKKIKDNKLKKKKKKKNKIKKKKINPKTKKKKKKNKKKNDPKQTIHLQQKMYFAKHQVHLSLIIKCTNLWRWQSFI